MKVLPSVKKLVIATVIVLLLTTMFSLYSFFNKPYNVVYAMIDAYEQIETLSGTLEYISERGNGRRAVDIIDFKFKKPNKFYTVRSKDNNTSYSKVYDGQDVMYTFSEKSDMVRVDFMDPEMQKVQLQWLLLDNFIDELKNHKDAIEPKQIESEVIAGKLAEGYEITFNYNGNITIHRIWVDRELNLPLKWELFYPGFTSEEGKVIPDERIVTSFIKLEINPQLDDNIFVYDKDPGKKYYLNTPPLPEPASKKVSKSSIDDSSLQIIDDIVNAYTFADKEVGSYSAVIHYYKLYEDIVLDVEKAEIKRKKPDKYLEIFYTVHGNIIREIYNGKDYWFFTDNEQHYDREFEQNDNELALLISAEQLKQIDEIVPIGSEKIAGRDTAVYKFRYRGSELYNKLWVDKETNLPLQVELNQGKLVHVKGFTELNLSPQLDNSIFTYKTK